MKHFRIWLAGLLVVLSFTANAQMYDGITHPTKFRIWTTINQPTTGDKSSLVSFFGYRQDVTPWFNITGIANYNFTANAFAPQVWLNFNIKEKFYILSRSIYNCKSEKYLHTLSATYKLPLGFMIDATWENLYDGDKFCNTDRLQAVGGWAHKNFVANCGYSMRAHKGVIANVRYKLTPLFWSQLKYDGGIKQFSFSLAYHWN